MNNSSNNKQLPLSELAPGESARVVQMRDIPIALRQRLTAMGLTPGALVTMIRRAPLGDPIEFCIRDARLCLRRDEIAPIFIERCA